MRFVGFVRKLGGAGQTRPDRATKKDRLDVNEALNREESTR